MADGSLHAVGQVRHTFHVEAYAEIDVLVRALGPFAVQGARIVGAELTERDGRVAIRIEVSGMTMARADLTAERLRAMPAVLGVGLGWRAAPQLVATSHTID